MHYQQTPSTQPGTRVCDVDSELQTARTHACDVCMLSLSGLRLHARARD